MNFKSKMMGFIVLGASVILLFFGFNLFTDDTSAARERYRWVKAPGQGSCDTFCKDEGLSAVYGGFDGIFNTHMYVCGVDVKEARKERARGSGYVPGKNVTYTGACNVPYKGREYTRTNFYCLCL